MDLIPTLITSKTTDKDSEAPPQTNKGSVNRSHHLLLPTMPETMAVFYRECLKNHAATIGGHALDGCGEFTPSLTSTPTDPSSLKCAACGCHRNFHRQEPEDPNHKTLRLHHLHHLHHLSSSLLPPPLHRSPSPSSESPTPVSHVPPPSHQIMLPLNTGNSRPARPKYLTLMKTENPDRTKRRRSKFTKEQKEKMCLFAEKMGWKMQNCDERLVEDFCKEIGIGKRVLQVWIHNKKQALRKGESEKACNDRNGDIGFRLSTSNYESYTK